MEITSLTHCNSPCILLTRPKDDAMHTAQLLEARGFQTISAPVMELSYLPHDHNLSKIMDTTQLIILTSRHAVASLASLNIHPNIPIYCVGRSTGDIARSILSHSPITTSDGDESDLLTLIDTTIPTTHSIYYPHGIHITGNLISSLKNKGYAIVDKSVYNMQPARHFSTDVIAALMQHRCHGVSFYSKRSAQLFTQLIEHHQLQASLSSLHAFCLSETIAKSLHSTSFKSIHSSSAPHEESLLEFIAKFAFN